ICGAKGETIASAEVVWQRGGESPAVEALLYRGHEPSQPIPAKIEASDTEQTAEAKDAAAASSAAATKPPTAKLPAGKPAGKTGALGGARPATGAAASGKTGKLSEDGAVSDTRSGVSTTSSTASPPTKRPSREKREETPEIKPTKMSAKEAALNRERL